jgi:imidazolonepropionase-like amidohydrolase
MLAAMTAGGARALGLAGQVGELRPGTRADVVLIDLEAPPFVPFTDLANHLVYGEEGSSVRVVLVDGRVVVRDGRVLTIDEEALRAEVRERAGVESAGGAAVADWAERLWPYVDEMYRRAAAYDVGFTRWAP